VRVAKGKNKGKTYNMVVYEMLASGLKDFGAVGIERG
jgi:hypothetical protein